MRKSALFLCAIVLILLPLGMLPALGVEVNQLATPSLTPSPTAVMTSAPTVIAPFSELEAPYLMIDGQSGSIVHRNDGLIALEESAGVTADFSALVTFYNPYSTSVGPWDYGFGFRGNNDGTYFIVVNSAEQWTFRYMSSENEVLDSNYGDLSDFDTATGGANVLRLVVVGEKAYFAVNDVEVVVLDVSANQDAGSVDLVTAFFTGDEQEDAATRYENFSVWSVGIAPTLTPTILPESGLTAEVGENRGEIERGGGQAWEYEGQAGEVLTIEVTADDPAAIDGEIYSDGYDTYLIIHAPDGSVLLEADDIEAGTITNTRVEDLELPEDGTYIFEVRSWDNRSGGEYTLVIESSAPDEATPTPRP